MMQVLLDFIPYGDKPGGTELHVSPLQRHEFVMVNLREKVIG